MVADLRQFFLHAAEALCKTQPLFHFKKLLFGALDAVAHALPRDALLLCNLRQRKVFVIIAFHDLALLFGEHVAVKIQQERDAQILCHSSLRFRAFSILNALL